nr:Lon protease family protein [Actinobacillus seminis]
MDWQDLTPTLNIQGQSGEFSDFFTLQPAASSAIKHFLQNTHRTLLVLKADDQTEYAKLLEKHIQSLQARNLSISGVRYVIEQGDSFSFPSIYIEPAQSLDDNFAAQKSVATALYFDQSQLFGTVRIHPCSQDIQLSAGLVHQLNNGVLILSAAAFLSQSDLWRRLKQLLLSKTFSWYSLHPYKSLPCHIPDCPLSLKVILLGSREELALLNEVDEELYHWADYAEIESYFTLNNAQDPQLWRDYVVNLAKQAGLPNLTDDGVNKLYQLLVRETESRSLISISPLKLTALLADAAAFTQDSPLSAVVFEQYFLQKYQQYGFLREQTYGEILNEQVFVATDGEMVGQINGLSVVEYQGTPISFGEPSRISCIVQFGDGEVVDVERKNELAGNLHSKGLMIAESCLANILELASQLPFSASIVFEQSYAEIDGDSASLAGFCVLTSALADLPLPQSIAVTGAIDQFGLVHSVGGVNDKIEGFFTLCERRGLTGSQGVIIPSATIHQLSLSEAVVSAVKNHQFSIWVVEDVYQACEILFRRHLVEEENMDYSADNQPLSRLIQQRIELRSEQQQKGGWLRRVFWGR